jgi:hypothetical protein
MYQHTLEVATVDLEFVAERELAKAERDEQWVFCDCGHDCCPCNAQCK